MKANKKTSLKHRVPFLLSFCLLMSPILLTVLLVKYPTVMSPTLKYALGFFLSHRLVVDGWEGRRFCFSSMGRYSLVNNIWTNSCVEENNAFKITPVINIVAYFDLTSKFAEIFLWRSQTHRSIPIFKHDALMQ